MRNGSLPGDSEHAGIEVWILQLRSMEKGLNNYTATISEAERVRAARFVRAIDRERFIVAHAALREILSIYCERSAGALEFQFNLHGKPGLRDFPQIAFNLSHSGQLALVAVARGVGRLGVDVEEVRSDALNEGVAERFFSPGELERLKSLDGQERALGFFRCWTRKEAYLKAIGCGISDEDLATVEVTLRREEEPEIVRGVASENTSNWKVFHLEPRPGFIAAVVAENVAGVLRVRNWHGRPYPCKS